MPHCKMSATQAGISHTFPAPYPSPKHSTLLQPAFFHSTAAAGLLLHMLRKYWRGMQTNFKDLLAIQIKHSQSFQAQK